MPNLNPLFVQVPCLQDYFVDKDTAQAMAGGIVTFYSAENHTVLKPVYQISAGPGPTYQYNALANPLILSSIGTFVDENGNDIIPYFYPYQGTPSSNPQVPEIELYYITVYSAQGVFQFSRDGVPNIAVDSSLDDAPTSQNLLSNSQFTTVSFSPLETLTLSVSGTNTISPIAPDWDIITTGTGTVTIIQAPVSGNLPIPSNPPYLLDIVATGGALSSPIYLRQTLENCPTLLQNGIASGYFVARSLDGLAHQLIMTYANQAASYELINDLTTATGFKEFISTPAVPINGAFDTTNSNNGYVTLTIQIPLNAHIQISSIQLVSVSNQNATPEFIPISPERQKDHVFHYHYDDILVRPKSSILTGWYFSLNPYQLPFPQDSNGDYTPTVNEYIADQTILIQQNIVKNNTGSNVKKGLTTNANLKITALTAHNQFALVQYIDPKTTYGYWGYFMSALGRLRLNSTNGTSVRYKIRLFWNANLPNIISQIDPIAAWEEGQDPQLAAGYNYILAENDPVYTIPPTVDPSNIISNDTFNKFVLPTTIFTENQTLGIIVYTLDNMSISGTPDYMDIQQVGLVRNQYACQIGPKTFSETLEDCQYYVETTYPKFSYPNINGAATPTTLNQLVAPLNAKVTAGGPPYTVDLFGEYLEIPWKTIKRITNSTIIVYSPITSIAGNIAISGYADNVEIIAPTDLSFSGNYALLNKGDKGAVYNCATASPFGFNGAVASVTSIYGFARFHAIIDARIGVLHL